MSTQQTAKTQYINAAGTTLAYRLFGSQTGIPLVFLQHFRGTMDHWDPALINPLALTRPILLLDYTGVGKSSGTIPTDFAGWATAVIALVNTLHIPQIDLLGFSMGGMAAQLVALKAPILVRRLILAGTGPSKGEGVAQGPEWAFKVLYSASTPAESEAAFLKTFYAQSEQKQALGKAWWARMNERSEDRSGYLGAEGTQRQAEAVIKWMSGEGETSYERLGELNIPVFVANGDSDIVVPTSNSYVLHQRIPGSHFHIYPDVGHGFLNEYAGLFAEHIRLFLDTERVM